MHRNKREFSAVLAVIPGKSEPKNMDAYWQRILQDFKECGPFGGETCVDVLQRIVTGSSHHVVHCNRLMPLIANACKQIRVHRYCLIAES